MRNETLGLLIACLMGAFIIVVVAFHDRWPIPGVNYPVGYIHDHADHVLIERCETVPGGWQCTLKK